MPPTSSKENLDLGGDSVSVEEAKADEYPGEDEGIEWRLGEGKRERGTNIL